MTGLAWKRTVFAGAAGVAAIVALTGCAGSGTVRADPTTTTTVTASPSSSSPSSDGSTTTPVSSASTSSTSSSTGSGSLRSTMCDASSLQGSLVAPNGGGTAGSQAYDIVFTNTGSSPCTLQGWPGVSFVGHGNGTQIGAAATFIRSSAHGTVTLTPGGVAHATVLVGEAGNFGSCGATPADGFRVYPPGSKQSVFVSRGQIALTACSSTQAQQLQVQGIQPGQ